MLMNIVFQRKMIKLKQETKKRVLITDTGTIDFIRTGSILFGSLSPVPEGIGKEFKGVLPASPLKIRDNTQEISGRSEPKCIFPATDGFRWETDSELRDRIKNTIDKELGVKNA